ncbi:hypothetical protein O9929_14940 [Vibrio lentus]|nr:hypothetical protein [Vibrio lentus]
MKVDINDDGKIDDDEVFLRTRFSTGYATLWRYQYPSLSFIIRQSKIRPRYKWFMDDWGVMSPIRRQIVLAVSEWLTLAPGYFWYARCGRFLSRPK